MAQASLIQVRVDEDFRKEVDCLFADLGFDTPTAIRIFLKQAVKQRGLPFAVRTDSKATSAQVGKRVKDFTAIMQAIDAAASEEMPPINPIRLREAEL